MTSRAQLKLDDNKHLISESIIEEEDEISVSTRETREGSIREGSINTTILINQELDGVEVKEGCNWEHGLTAAIEIGTPEKTVGASFIALSGVYLL